MSDPIRPTIAALVLAKYHLGVRDTKKILDMAVEEGYDRVTLDDGSVLRYFNGEWKEG